nr:hypothetical protein Iba_chr13aCG10590 [Ipomoea batatas]
MRSDPSRSTTTSLLLRTTVAPGSETSPVLGSSTMDTLPLAGSRRSCIDSIYSCIGLVKIREHSGAKYKIPPPRSLVDVATEPVLLRRGPEFCGGAELLDLKEDLGAEELIEDVRLVIVSAFTPPLPAAPLLKLAVAIFTLLLCSSPAFTSTMEN